MVLFAPTNERKAEEVYQAGKYGLVPCLNVEELAGYFGVTERTIRNYVRYHGLPVEVCRGVLRFPLTDVVAWADGWKHAADDTSAK